VTSKVDKKTNLTCPMCRNSLSHFEGATDDSGSFYKPSVSCSCGFSWKSTKEVRMRVGESGWDAIFREKSEINEKIFELFGNPEALKEG
jgi:hypothetical protein